MDVNYVVLILVAVVLALAYGLLGWLKEYIQNGQKFDLTTFLTTIVYSIVVGLVAVQTGLIDLTTLSNWQSVFSVMWISYAMVYTGLLYIVGKIVTIITTPLASKTTFFPKKASVDPNRKMDEESRHWLVSDQKTLGNAILGAVNSAESVPTWRYAIEAGAWIYLVEFGEVTGAKHYFFRNWFGTSHVSWKPITSQCLEAIRSTGRFPDYDKLY